MRTACILLLTATAALAAEPASRSIVVAGQGFFPVALPLADGRIAVVLRGGAPHVGINGRLDIVFSSDQGKTWTKPALVVDTPVDDRNPAFGQAADGSLVVAYWRTARYDDRGNYNPELDKPVDTWVTRSADGGKTWSTPTRIDVTDIGWGSPYGKILTMPDQSMLMNIYGGPVRSAGQKPDNPRDHSYLYRSTDHGRTWARFAMPGGPGFNETGLLRLRGGQLLAALRSDGMAETWLARSVDGGRTWSKPAKVAPGRVHPADLVQLADGRIIMTVGYRVGPFGVRGLVGTPDGGFDWQDQIVLVNDAAGRDCGYPSSVVLADGRVLTVYYATALTDRRTGLHCGAVRWQVPEGPASAR